MPLCDMDEYGHSSTIIIGRNNKGVKDKDDTSKGAAAGSDSLRPGCRCDRMKPINRKLWWEVWS